MLCIVTSQLCKKTRIHYDLQTLALTGSLSDGVGVMFGGRTARVFASVEVADTCGARCAAYKSIFAKAAHARASALTAAVSSITRRTCA
jgi:hypothetical protein